MWIQAPQRTVLGEGTNFHSGLFRQGEHVPQRWSIFTVVSPRRKAPIPQYLCREVPVQQCLLKKEASSTVVSSERQTWFIEFSLKGDGLFHIELYEEANPSHSGLSEESAKAHSGLSEFREAQPVHMNISGETCKWYTFLLPQFSGTTVV
jgi:hypothetical protein